MLVNEATNMLSYFQETKNEMAKTKYIKTGKLTTIDRDVEHLR